MSDTMLAMEVGNLKGRQEFAKELSDTMMQVAQLFMPVITAAITADAGPSYGLQAEIRELTQAVSELKAEVRGLQSRQDRHEALHRPDAGLRNVGNPLKETEDVVGEPITNLGDLLQETDDRKGSPIPWGRKDGEKPNNEDGWDY